MPPAAVLAQASPDDQLPWAKASRPLRRRSLPRVTLIAPCHCPEVRRARAPLRSSSRRACANVASRARPGATDLAMRCGRSTGGQMRPPVRRPRQMAEACSATAPSYAKAPDPSWPPRRNGASPSPVPADRRRHHRYSSPVLNLANSPRHANSHRGTFRHRDKHRLRRRRLKQYSLHHIAGRAPYSASSSPLSCCSAAAPSAFTTCGTATESLSGSARRNSTGSTLKGRERRRPWKRNHPFSQDYPRDPTASSLRRPRCTPRRPPRRRRSARCISAHHWVVGALSSCAPKMTRRRSWRAGAIAA